MSAGVFIDAAYESNDGRFYPMKIQPETITLTLNSIVNASATGPADPTLPSAVVSKGRRSRGVNCRLVRIRTPALGGDANYVPRGIIALPVFLPSVFSQYGRTQVGTYEINGVDIPVQFVGKTPEAIL